jgi:hypothetical protein
MDGIGLQSHFPERVTPMDDLMKRLDRFAAFEKELEITEFDINTSDKATQADYTRDFMTATFSPALRLPCRLLLPRHLRPWHPRRLGMLLSGSRTTWPREISSTSW